MAWHLKPAKYALYENNVLEAVIAQLRFHPILKVDSKVPDFQEAVRSEFPSFASTTLRNVSVGDVGVEVADEAQFQFTKIDEPTTISLSSSALTLETKKHTTRKDFQAKMELALDALIKTYSPIAPVRLGLRYVDTIRKDLIGKDLGREIEWKDLISPEFLRLPGGLADLQDTRFMQQIESPLEPGLLTLRYGIISDTPSNELVYRLENQP